MVNKKFQVSARISSSNPSAVKPVLEKIIGCKGTVKFTSGEFQVDAELEAESAKDLNRGLLSEIRRAEKKTRIRAEYTYCNTIERFFDYVQKAARNVQKP